MFTIEQIKSAHAKVKSGADFPAYIQEIKQLGVKAYTHYVSDGHIEYAGDNDFALSGDPKWPAVVIAAKGDRQALQQSLSIHQQGQTNYPTFCSESAEAGVDNWVVDIEKMKCIYYDVNGEEMLAEVIPS